MFQEDDIYILKYLESLMFSGDTLCVKSRCSFS